MKALLGLVSELALNIILPGEILKCCFPFVTDIDYQTGTFLICSVSGGNCACFASRCVLWQLQVLADVRDGSKTPI